MKIIFSTHVPYNWWHKWLAYKFLVTTVTEKWLFITFPSEGIQSSHLIHVSFGAIAICVFHHNK